MPIPRLSPPRRLLHHLPAVVGRWKQLGVVRSPEVLSVADFDATVHTDTSASQDPEHGSNEEDEAEDQRRQRHKDCHALARGARLDVLTGQMCIT